MQQEFRKESFIILTPIFMITNSRDATSHISKLTSYASLLEKQFPSPPQFDLSKHDLTDPFSTCWVNPSFTQQQILGWNNPSYFQPSGGQNPTKAFASRTMIKVVPKQPWTPEQDTFYFNKRFHVLCGPREVQRYQERYHSKQESLALSKAQQESEAAQMKQDDLIFFQNILKDLPATLIECFFKGHFFNIDQLIETFKIICQIGQISLEHFDFSDLTSLL